MVKFRFKKAWGFLTGSRNKTYKKPQKLPPLPERDYPDSYEAHTHTFKQTLHSQKSGISPDVMQAIKKELATTAAFLKDNNHSAYLISEVIHKHFPAIVEEFGNAENQAEINRFLKQKALDFVRDYRKHAFTSDTEAPITFSAAQFGPTNPATANELYNSAKELLETEKNYNQRLRELQKNLDKMNQKGTAEDKIIEPVLKDLQSLIHHSDKLIKRMEPLKEALATYEGYSSETVEQPVPPQMIAVMTNSLARAYDAKAMNQMYVTMAKYNAGFEQITSQLSAIRNDKYFDFNQLNSLLIEPVQRGPRYRMLFAKIDKRVDELHSEDNQSETIKTVKTTFKKIHEHTKSACKSMNDMVGIIQAYRQVDNSPANPEKQSTATPSKS